MGEIKTRSSGRDVEAEVVRRHAMQKAAVLGVVLGLLWGGAVWSSSRRDSATPSLSPMPPQLAEGDGVYPQPIEYLPRSEPSENSSLKTGFRRWSKGPLAEWADMPASKWLDDGPAGDAGTYEGHIVTGTGEDARVNGAIDLGARKTITGWSVVGQSDEAALLTILTSEDGVTWTQQNQTDWDETGVKTALSGAFSSPIIARYIAVQVRAFSDREPSGSYARLYDFRVDSCPVDQGVDGNKK